MRFLPAPRPLSATAHSAALQPGDARRARWTVGAAGVTLILLAVGFRAVPDSVRPTLAPAPNSVPAADLDRFSPSTLGSDSYAGQGVSAGSDSTTAATTSSPVPTPSATTATAVLVSALAANGIPEVAFDAYQRAAAQYGALVASCHVSWPLLAAIGRVESDHGQFGGAVLLTNGTSVPKIIGRALNGVGTAVIPATPLGITLDGDQKYDHAIGPMQIIPSTWVRYAVAATGHSTADPFNIYDAAVTAARYLCTAAGDLSTLAGQQRAVLAYNHSSAYVATVLDLEATYAGGRPNLQVPAISPSTPLPPATPPVLPPADPGPPPAVVADPGETSTATGSGSPTPSVTPTPTDGDGGTSTATGIDTPPPDTTPTSPSDSDSPTTTPSTPSDSPTPSASSTPSNAATPTDSTADPSSISAAPSS